MQEAEVAAGDGDVEIAGGASTVRQALAAGAIDELMLDVVPILLGSGEGLFDGLTDVDFEPLEVIHSPHATHIRPRQAMIRRTRHGTYALCQQHNMRHPLGRDGCSVCTEASDAPDAPKGRRGGA